MRALAFVALAIVVAACSRRPERVDVEPALLRLAGGEQAQVRALPWASTGRPMPDQQCRWSSSNPAVATVTARHNDAIVTAMGPGTATIRCEVHGRAGELAVSVLDADERSLPRAGEARRLGRMGRPRAELREGP